MSLELCVRAGAWAVGGAAAFAVIRQDSLRRRIPNAVLRLLALGILAGYVLLSARFVAAFYRDGALSAGASLLAGVALWRLGVWPAGDAKLFILLAWLAPLAEPALAAQRWRLPLVLLLNTFIPAAAVILAAGGFWFWHTRLRHGAGFLGQMGLCRFPEYAAKRHAELKAQGRRAGLRLRVALTRRPGRLASSLADQCAMAGAGAAFMTAAQGWAGGVWAALIFCVFWDGARRSVGAWTARLAAGAAVACLWSLGAPAAELGSRFGLWLLFSLGMAAGRGALSFVMGAREKFIALAWVAGPLLAAAPWALGAAGGWERWAWAGLFGGFAWGLALLFLEEDGFILPPDRVTPSLVPSPATLAAVAEDAEFSERHFRRVYPDGLTSRQAAALRGWAGRRGLAHLSFRRTRPFAAWICLGGGLSVLLGRDLLSAGAALVGGGR